MTTGRNYYCALYAMTICWLALIGFGFKLWEEYDSNPGGEEADAVAAETDRAGIRIELYMHPLCPCTRASLEALGSLLACNPGTPARVWFVKPAGTADGWDSSGLWTTAAAIPAVEVVRDADGRSARLAGAETSGLAVVLDGAGNTLFRGGLTRGRGRTGDAEGLRAVNAILAGREPETRRTPVFGCPLFEPGEKTSTIGNGHGNRN